MIRSIVWMVDVFLRRGSVMEISIVWAMKMKNIVKVR